MRPSLPRVCLCKLQQTCVPGSSGPVWQVRRPGHHHPGPRPFWWMCVPHAVHMHDSLRIFEASSCGHMFNMSSSQVTNGNGAMPAFGEKLGPDDIEAEHAIAAVVATGCLAATCYDIQEQLMLSMLFGTAFLVCFRSSSRTWPTTSTARLTSGELLLQAIEAFERPSIPFKYPFHHPLAFHCAIAPLHTIVQALGDSTGCLA